MLPEYKTLIFDEAHKLYDVAKQMYGCLTETEAPKLVEYIEESKIQSMKYACTLIKTYNTKIFNQLLSAAPENFRENPRVRMHAKLGGQCLRYMKSLSDLLEDIIGTIYSNTEVKTFKRKKQIKKMCEKINRKLITFRQPDNLICWIEYDEMTVMLCSIPKQLNKIVADSFWETDTTRHILTSGTLSANGDFGLIKSKTGIDLIPSQRIRETSKKSPFDYQRNAYIHSRIYAVP